ncbi:MAG: NlpC/P60 family protein, partial [Lachnospiraceae bacterium]|nr:NlpC/P60 family protein [Lachnospiraceae bacterium]
MQTKTTKLRFSPDDLADAKVRRAAEKAEKAVEKADAAKARLPSKKLRTKTTTAQAQGEKLRFGKKVIVVEETVKKHAAIGKKAAAKSAAASVSGTAHKQAAEYQDDNVGVQAVNETTGAAEAAVQTGETLRYSHKLKDYHHAEKLEAKADKANIEALFQKEAAKNPGAASNPFSRWRQKQAIRKEYAAMKAGKESAGTAASHAVGKGAEAAKSAGKAVKEGKSIGTWAVNFVKNHGHVLLILGGLL